MVTDRVTLDMAELILGISHQAWDLDPIQTKEPTWVTWLTPAMQPGNNGKHWLDGVNLTQCVNAPIPITQ